MSRWAVLALVLLGSAAAIATVRHSASRPGNPVPAPAHGNNALSKDDRTAAAEIYFRGVPLAQAEALGWPGLAERREAAARFPTAQSCLAPAGEGEAANSINWNKVSSDREVEVCLARVASTLSGPQAIAAWLQGQGFRLVGVRPADESTTSMEARERRGVVIEAFWPVDTNGPLHRGSLISRTLQSAVGQGTSVQIFVSESRQVVSVSATTNYL